MLAILPLITYLLLVMVLAGKRPAAERLSLRLVLLEAALAWGLFMILVLELLSPFAAITAPAVAAAWALAIVALVVMLLRARRPSLFGSQWLAGLSLAEKGALLGIGGLIVVTGFTALASPPNSFDAMTYHMSRVMHWVQYRSLSFYPTPILRQLHSAPWAEYVILNWQLLLGSDHLANTVQWSGYGGCIVAASLIAQELGGNRSAQILSGLVAATIPMAVLQASGTQTDCVAALWCSSLVLFILRSRRLSDWRTAAALGASAGLAALTKATTGVIALPFVLWYIWGLLRRPSKRALLQAALVLSLVVAVSAPQSVRNVQLYEHLLGPGNEGPQGRYRYTNDLHTPAALASNIVRNLSLHLATVAPVNAKLEKLIVDLHHALGIDPSDERTTWTWTFFAVSGLSLHEGTAGNTLHLLLATLSLVAVGILPAARRRQLWGYGLGCVASFLAFCFLLRWQPWNSRLHLPWFVLLCPLIATTAQLVLKRLWSVLALALFLYAMPYLFFNPTRAIASVPATWVERHPILGGLAPDRTLFNTPRWSRYFNDQQAQDSYRVVVAYVLSQGDRDVGLFLGMNDWEYPYWALLHAGGEGDIVLRHLGVDNISASLYAQDELALPRLALVREPAERQEIVWHGAVYRLVLCEPYSAVYQKEP
jgi:4-amino-4-deoxy-L-arabinose transferase-like glycosyltransferase